ncbi:MAG: packaged DNA stabilization protein gp10 [Candidatus Bathyarchaeota archaeon]|nr:packaged DNA stabilization protein gp10 [Candidatus Bathyarchaeota archaeon]
MKTQLETMTVKTGLRLKGALSPLKLPIQKLRHNRRAISPVIASMMLIGVVIILGFAVLAYARTLASNYEAQYQQDTSNGISRLKETLCFEYVSYNATGHLSVYFINAGSTSFEIDKAYLSPSSTAIEPTVRYLSGELASNKTLRVGDQRLIDLYLPELSSGSHTVRLTTIRGSSFEYTFNI